MHFVAAARSAGRARSLGSHARQVCDELLCCLVPAPAYLGAEHEEPLRVEQYRCLRHDQLAGVTKQQHES